MSIVEVETVSKIYHQGKVTFKAELNYMKLVKPVAELLKVPEDETEVVLINDAATWVEIYD